VTEQLPSAPCPATVSGWLGQYYLGRAFDGGSVVCRDDASINFNWASGSPDPAVPINDFSVRWTKTVTFAAGTHNFVAGSDDGVRVYIDGVLVINAWVDRSYATTSASRALTAGQHTIVMEFYEHGGSARATLTWT